MTVDLDALVACPGFRWMPRMEALDDIGERWDVVATEDGEVLLRAAGEDGRLRWVEPGDIRPNLDDPATCGCIETLVAEAWGPDVTIAHIDGRRVRSTTLASPSGGVLFRVEGKPKGERLAAALFASPKRPEVGHGS